MQRPVITDILRACGFCDLGDDPLPEAKQAALENLRTSMIGLEPTDMVLLRQEAAGALMKTGMGSRDAKDLVKAARSEGGRDKNEDKELHGQAIALTDPEPWPDQVTGEEVLGEVVRTLTRYVALHEGAATTIALWILHAPSLRRASRLPAYSGQ